MPPAVFAYGLGVGITSGELVAAGAVMGTLSGAVLLTTSIATLAVGGYMIYRYAYLGH